jgi:hypothetical protein
MQPYYQSWQESSHNMVSCIDCHFPPGIQSEVGRKFKALVQVAKYVTRSYGTRPWTEIDDASCLRPGCHDKRLLKGKVDFNGIPFDHQPHLTGFRRVTRLRCTSCHSQLVQGQHMVVTESTCFFCHLAPGPSRDQMARCTNCHTVPMPRTKSGFSHDFAQERQVDCQLCHADVIHGDGAVSKSRCQLCHSEPARVTRYSDAAFVHLKHVTDHKIDCANCHDPIDHRQAATPAMPPPTKDQGMCATCHQSKHLAISLLYAGKGGQGVDGVPDPMYEARVTCEACHWESTPGEMTSARGGAAGCMYCHGESYGKYVAQWRAEFGLPVTRLSDAVLRARSIVAKLPPGSVKQRAWQLVEEAVSNVHLVRYGRGAHNPAFSRRLLEQGAAQANQALALAASDYRVPAPKIVAPAASACLNCHDVPGAPARAFGLPFDHERHVRTAQLNCETCHRDGMPQGNTHGSMFLTKESCRACHQGKVKSPHATGWKQRHGAEAARGRAACEVCHQPQQCASCHGLTMPHPSGWQGQHGGQAGKDAALCRRCHQEQECTACHGLPLPHPENFALEHAGKASFKPGTLCFKCHDLKKDCTECHADAGQ